MGQKGSSVHDVVHQEDVTKLETLLLTSGSGQKHDLDINELKGDRTAVFKAVCEEKHHLVASLVRHGADVNIRCSLERQNGHKVAWTALHESCRTGDLDMLTILLSAPGINVDVTGHHQMTPLHVAAWHGHCDVIQTLLKADCNVNELDQFRESAIVVPVCTGDTAVVELLLEGGCKLNSRAWGNLRKIGGKHDCDFRDHLYDRDGPYSLFTLAIKFSWLHIACLLLRHGFNANKYQLYDLLTLIKESTGTVASEDAQLLVQCLLQAGYKIQNSTSLERTLDVCNRLKCEHIYAGLLQKKVEQPDSLKEQCRAVVRARLRVLGSHASVLNRLPKTGLPNALEEYVAMTEFCNVFQGDRFETEDENRHLLYFAMPRKKERGTNAMSRPLLNKKPAKSIKT